MSKQNIVSQCTLRRLQEAMKGGSELLMLMLGAGGSFGSGGRNRSFSAFLSFREFYFVFKDELQDRRCS